MKSCDKCGVPVVKLNAGWAHAWKLGAVIKAALRRGVPVVHDIVAI